MLLVEAVERRHLRRVEREVENRGIFDDSLAPRRFRDGDEILLERPAEEDLRGGAAGRARHRPESRVLEHDALGERAVGDDDDPVRLAELDDLALLAPGMKLDLVDRR